MPAEPLSEHGFTLLEVLVALVIVALGLMAAFGQLSQSITAANRLREKTFAHWVAVDRLTELRLNAQSRGAFPPTGETTDEVDMAGATWRYKVTVSKTETDDIRRVQVSVSYADRPGREVAAVTGALGRTAAAAGSGVRDADWYELKPGEESPPP